MARTRTPTSIRKSISTSGKPKIYVEGGDDDAYLTALAHNGVILDYVKGTELPATAVDLRIQAIRQDLGNDAIERVIWIVDGGDEHIKESKNFIKFYKEWMRRKDKDREWKKLHVLINVPCLEYWFLLHRTDPPLDNNGVPICFENANALLNSAKFREHCQEGKGADLVCAIVRNVGRKQAMQRAKNLNNQLDNPDEKKLLKVARAEMYKIFELIKVEPPGNSS